MLLKTVLMSFHIVINDHTGMYDIGLGSGAKLCMPNSSDFLRERSFFGCKNVMSPISCKNAIKSQKGPRKEVPNSSTDSLKK